MLLLRISTANAPATPTSDPPAPDVAFVVNSPVGVRAMISICPALIDVLLPM